MSKDDEIDFALELKSMRKESREWRKASDEAFLQFMGMYGEEKLWLKNKIETIEKKVSDNTIDIERFNKIESFIENISKFSTWVFKFLLGFIAIGSAIWASCVFVYHYIKGL